ncbi:MAG: hypothetical protein K8R40_03335 [Anaerolineaceae bacterium]|nr:hypothetical protein [Anaerolineaceae bacterium]
MTDLRFFLLGKPRIEKNGEPYTELQSPQIFGLLAYLLADCNKMHTREELFQVFWPDASKTAARNKLRVALFRLKSAFQDVLGEAQLISDTTQSIGINPDCQFWADTCSFQNVVERYQDEFFTTGTLTLSAINDLIQVLQLYKQEFLYENDFDNLKFKNWLFFKKEQFRQYASWTNDRLLEYYEGNRKYEQCLKYSRFGLIMDPWDEKLHQQHMRFLTLTGKSDQALEHFDRLKEVFSQERGIPLSGDTETLYQQIQDSEDGKNFNLVIAKTGQSTKNKGNLHNFPPGSYNFLGREEHLENLRELLAEPEHRMINIVGPGGIGKTQLAIQTAMNCRDIFTDGIFYLPMEAPTTSRLFASHLAYILGLHTTGHKATQSQVLEALQNMNILLVLDNVRQMNSLDFFLRNLIERAPRVRLLTTSQTSLNMKDEIVFTISGLEYPSVETTIIYDEAIKYPAVHLFERFSQMYNIHTIDNEDEINEVVQICRMLDGHPLGIELAANWASMSGCKQTVADMERGVENLDKRFEALPDSRRYLRIVNDLTWAMLNEREQLIFEKLSIFPGGFKREIADLIINANQHDLLTLKRHAFIDRSQKTGRYYVHPLLKEYAYQHLIESNQEDPTAEKSFRHDYCEFFLYFLFKRYMNLVVESNWSQVYEIQYELPNIRQAWEEAIHYGLYEQVRQAAPALMMFYRRLGSIGEGLMEIEPLVSTLRVMLQDQGLTEVHEIYKVLSSLLIEKAYFLVTQNSLEYAKRVTEQALEYALSAPDALGQMRCAYLLADIAVKGNNHDRALRELDEAMEIISKETLDFDPQIVQIWVAWCFELYAEIMMFKENYEEAIARLERAIPLYKNSDQVMRLRQCEQKILIIEKIRDAS